MNEEELIKNISSGVQQGMKSYFTEHLKKLNLFILPQIIWLLELYFLMLNALLKAYDNFNFPEITTSLPTLIVEYNKMILKLMDEWIPFVGILGVGLLLSSFFICHICVISKIGQYNIIRRYSSYGMFIFGWFILIFLTHFIYNWLQSLFPLAFVFLIVIVYLEAFINKIFNIKLNIFLNEG